ncbi:hypothetical protein Taro_002100 [Colocasia esculenta]|uniref:DNA ligase ATP-dependent N-terminal domain-containing protein n=1 Tax=Colocasia esculenta TaxID=4460 RepID=A0A843TGF9_COLES|nr:hypothetical protein [Colocasia esculenta]
MEGKIGGIGPESADPGSDRSMKIRVWREVPELARLPAGFKRKREKRTKRERKKEAAAACSGAGGEPPRSSDGERGDLLTGGWGCRGLGGWDWEGGIQDYTDSSLSAQFRDSRFLLKEGFVTDSIRNGSASRGSSQDVESGNGSVTRKKNLVVNLMCSCREMEMKFLVRTLVRNLRIGAMIKTILPALAQAVVLNKSLSMVDEKSIEGLKVQLQGISAAVVEAYNVLPNLVRVSCALLPSTVFALYIGWLCKG